MKEIDKNLYLIEKNNNLYQKALAIVNRPLLNNYKNLYDDFRDTAEILKQIIDDRSDQIDEGVKKSLNNNSAFYIESKQICKCFLNKDTENIIEKLFERENMIHKLRMCGNVSLCIDEEEK